MQSLYKQRSLRISASLPILILSATVTTIALVHLFYSVCYPYSSPVSANLHATIPTRPASDSSDLVNLSDVNELLRLRQHHQYRRQRLLSSMPECAQSGRASTFLMVFMGHSGTTALMTSLQQHSQVHIDGFEPVDHGIYASGSSRNTSLLALQRTKAYFTNGTKLGKTTGFKIRPRQLLARPTEFSALTRSFRTRIIWSYRSNMLKQALGDYTIHIHGDDTAYEGIKVDENGVAVDGKNRSTRFPVKMTELHKMVKSRVIGDRQVARALELISPDHCVLPVSYESYLQMPELTLERVQMFLGLDNREMHPALRAKATQDSICDLVENWDELCEAFYGCDTWRWMLDDFENGCACSALRPSRFTQSKQFCAMA